MLLIQSSPTRSRRPISVVAVALLSIISRLAHAADDPAAPTVEAREQPVFGAATSAIAQLRDDNIQSGDSYAPEFDYFDRSLLGRQRPQDSQPKELKNNEKRELDIDPGQTAYFVLKRGQKRLTRADKATLDALEARGLDDATEDPSDDVAVDGKATGIGNEDNEPRRRQVENRIWISANTCKQPNSPTNGTAAPKNHPQLVMFVSTSSRNQKPGPDSINGLATPPSGIIFGNGFANFSLQADSDIFIGISAPTLEDGWFGSWQFDLAASTNGPYHSYNGNDPFLFMIDTDSESALFITYNLSDVVTRDVDKWRQRNPFRMYAFESDKVTPVTGLERSLCAIQNSNRTTNITDEVSITTKFGGDLPKAQFHLQGLKAGKTYNGFLTVQGGQDVLQLPGNTSVRSGGMVFQQFNFTTKADDTCQVIFDLDFCDSVAYAVPSNPNFRDDEKKLKARYDNLAKDYYANFSRSLAQVACDTAAEAQYSLARTCKDCEKDYKSWLCSVLIPRCEDWEAPGNWLQQRNINAPLSDGSLTFGGNVSKEFNDTRRLRLGYNSTRNPGIDPVTPLGPYKEMLPCEDLCFDIVRSCPAKLAFACPNSPAKELAYGKRDPKDRELRCNFPGAVVKLNIRGAVGMLDARLGLAVLMAVLVAASML